MDYEPGGYSETWTHRVEGLDVLRLKRYARREIEVSDVDLDTCTYIIYIFSTFFQCYNYGSSLPKVC